MTSKNVTIDLSYYHPDVWSYNGFPHDTFAVQFALKNDVLSVYVEVIVVCAIWIAFLMVTFLIVI